MSFHKGKLFAKSPSTKILSSISAGFINPGKLEEILTAFASSKSGVEYFEKTIELCKKNDCQLILMTYPVIDTATSLNRIQECRDFYTEFALKYELGYMDMMLCKDYTKVKDDAYDFSDTGHMNDVGARKYTYYVCNELKHIFNGDDYSKDFYSDAKEWMGVRKKIRE